ncbi:MAG: hypothetical protein GHCLOJNM_02134 [bacterium]|nr:hypothetical protein [bacterium]
MNQLALLLIGGLGASEEVRDLVRLCFSTEYREEVFLGIYYYTSDLLMIRIGTVALVQFPLWTSRLHEFFWEPYKVHAFHEMRIWIVTDVMEKRRYSKVALLLCPGSA